MTEYTRLQRVLAGIIADTFDENAHIDSNRPDVTDTIWKTAVKVSDHIESAFTKQTESGKVLLKKEDCNADCYKCDIAGSVTIRTVQRLRERLEK